MHNTPEASGRQPFVKWAGGKRQLLREIHARLPRRFNRYYEPFVGGGAVFFDLAPQNAIVNDINASLINAYLQIRDDPNGLMSILDGLDYGQKESQDAKAYYYDMRERYNERISSGAFDALTAALFIYLNKHCFNGLYRVNARGQFNVPFNGSNRVSYVRDNILGLSNMLEDVEITNDDFEAACADAQAGDFVFFDSPYAPLNPTSFESYTKEGFSQEEHERLSRLYRELTKRGCYCMLTNHNTPFIQELYKDFKLDVVAVRRSINSDASKRSGTEVIITNYDIPSGLSA